MTVNDDLTELLGLIACPKCRSPLGLEPATLVCSGCGSSFDFHEGVPALLDSDRVGSHSSLMARAKYAVLGNPRLYDFHQAHGGGRPIAAHVARALHEAQGRTILDVGAGTGMVAGIAPADTRYIWLDNDTLKLRGFLSKSIDALAVLGDGTRLPFRDDASDTTVMVEVAHHLPDVSLRACFDEIARVTRHRFLFVDALRGARLRSRLLWQLDLGRFPRGEDELLSALGASFEIASVERFRVNHDHLLCLCTPRVRPTGDIH
jgi:SAM-dependent methyltransferase